MTKQILTQAILKEHLHYDPNVGVFTWVKKTSPFSKIKIGCFAGHKQTNGYVRIKIFNFKFLAHHLAWMYVYGKFPETNVDHINGNTFDNSILNLRLSTFSENQQNRKLSRVNKSGYTGVGFNKATCKWRAIIYLNNKEFYLGSFNTPEEAHQSYVAAKSLLHTFNPVLRES